MDILSTLVQQIGLKDVIDIVVVSLIIYQVLIIVHGTRALQMLIGVGVMVILFWFAVSFKLYSLNWILGHFFDSFFIIAIIIFQDQIRSALATMGTGKGLFFSRSVVDLDREVDEVVEACGPMGREKIGALMVFERKQGLGNYIDTGTKLDSKLHSDLLYAIFESSSPLHDGAVIIRGGRLVAAGCFLPLSKNIEVDRHLGTRHRAALGVSELTDAVVVTVSEETGRVNVCVNGVFHYCPDLGVLRQNLRRLLIEDDTPNLDGRLPGESA